MMRSSVCRATMFYVCGVISALCLAGYHSRESWLLPVRYD